jgi:deoxyribodipyrimidine photo-lyase
MTVKNPTTFNKRVRMIRDRPYRGGPVVYWISRDQRAHDNWALVHSIQLANEAKVPLCVVFCLVPQYLGACIRQYGFMIKGLMELEQELTLHGIEIVVLEGLPEIVLPSFLHSSGAGILVTDFDPLREKREWKKRLAGEINMPFQEVDAHNVVPCWLASKRRIMTHKAFKEKVAPFLDEFLIDFPPLKGPEEPWPQPHRPIDWPGILARLRVDRTVKEVDWIEPGEKAADASMKVFLGTRLSSYPERSSNPTVHGQSDLSPYFHFGHLSSQRVAIEVMRTEASEEAKSKYLDQLIVKKELSDNFIFHTPEYDTFGAFPKWARDSIDAHRSDEREHLYALEQFENSQTHDQLWNSAQMELVKIGKIQGSLREYWAHKIMEWTPSPEEALSIALQLNNRWGLDARDPSGYTGIAFVIGGLFDRPWASKEVIGKVRKMTYTGERLRYDVHEYEERIRSL